jgi:serine/threonine-protein kinase HipA
MKNNRCYFCYGLTQEKSHFHPACLKKLFGSDQVPEISFNNKEIEALALELVKQKQGIPGVQKKLSLALEKGSDKQQRLTIVGYLGGNYILKPPTNQYPFMPEIEDLTMHLASIAKIPVALHGLIPMQDGKLAYITKRFDRNGNKKIAAEDLCQLSQKSTDDKYKSSSERVGKIIYQYTTTPGDEVLKFFELILFCFIVGNADMHLKNFSLITDDYTNITTAPNYDLLATRLLISANEDREELALSINGKKSNLTKKDFFILGKNQNIPEKVIQNSIDSMSQLLPKWQQMIQNSFLSEVLILQFENLILERLKRLS